MHFALTLSGLESAFSAAERVNERTIDGIRYKCKTDQALLMQYMSLKSFKSNDMKTKNVSSPVPARTSDYRIKSFTEPLSQMDRDFLSAQQVSSVCRPLHFSTYGSSVEPEVVRFPFNSLNITSSTRRHNSCSKEATILNELDIYSCSSMTRFPLSWNENDSQAPLSLRSVNCTESLSYRRSARMNNIYLEPAIHE